MKAGFRRPDNGNIDGRLTAVDAEIESAERHHSIVAFLFSAFEAFNKRRRDELNLSGRHAVKVRSRGDVDDAYLNLRSRVRERHIGAPLVLFGRVTADDECHSNHGISWTRSNLNLFRSRQLAA